ncbi:MAG TPA: phosphoribosylanthranilate isomerase [Ferruginibacter sp.]|nr:phosphoribosylanthranilate isomerase [Ferruginibacter sp.]HPH92965.1 phosphoribosylanthranilate isomerase [Ferruginibacter sp.]
MNIKVCGITQLKQLQQLDGLNIDFAGLDFQKDSVRFLGDKIPADDLKESDFDVKKTGVFNNAEMIDMLDAIDAYGLDVIQLNGNENTEVCADLSEEVEVIKTFQLADEKMDIDEMVAEYDEVCDYYLFENTAKKFDWKILAKAKIEKPFFIGGVITVEDAAAIKKIKHPDFYGININTHFEKEPGVKDMGLILQLKKALGW